MSSEQLPAATPEHSEGHQITQSVSMTQPGETVSKGWQGGPPIEAAIKAQIAERLRQDPLINYSELALELGVSDDVVGRIARKIVDGDTDLGDKRVKSYQRQIAKALPVSERVMIYADVARGKGDPKASFSKLGALKRLEELEGIVTRKEQREVADNSAPNLPAMFVMPANTDVDIGVAIKVRAKKNSG